MFVNDKTLYVSFETPCNFFKNEMSLIKCDSEKMFANEQSEKFEKYGCIIRDNILIGETYVENEDSNVERMTLGSFNKDPDFIGMIDAETEEEVTFAQMKDRSIRCALWLRKHGIDKNDVIGISTANQINDYVPYLAALYINAIVNPWHYTSTEENAQYCFVTCQPKVMFACEQSIDKLSAIAKDNGIDCKFVAFKRHSEYISLKEILEEQTVQEVENFKCTIPSNPKKKVSLMIYSSGTTSTPKVVILSYYTLMARQLKGSGLENDMICLFYSAFAWIIYPVFVLASIRQRCTRIVHEHFDVEFSASIVEKYKVNFVFMRPYLLVLWHQAKAWTRYDFSRVRAISVAGTRANETLLMNCQAYLPETFIHNNYGATEAGGFITKKESSCKYIDSVGFVCGGMQLKIVDPSTSALLGPNRRGEIYIRADTNMLGYFQNAEETKKTIDEDGWLRTGDLGHYDENGEIIMGDRLKATIKIRSHTLLPSEIEDLLVQHPAVEDCAVVAVDHPIDVERPFMFIVKAHGARVTAEELIDLAASKNELYRLTSGLIFVDELPLTPSGKKWLMKLLEIAKEHSLRHSE